MYIKFSEVDERTNSYSHTIFISLKIVPTHTFLKGTMEKSIIISTEGHVNNIVFQLQDDPTLFENWTTFARRLNTPEIMIRKHRNNLLINREKHEDVLTNILHFWVGKNDSSATLETLCIVLRDISSVNLAEKLESNFKEDMNFDELIKDGHDFATIPAWTREFFASTSCKVLVVKSADPDVTLARFYDKINPEHLDEGDLNHDLGVTGLFKLGDNSMEKIISLLDRTSKSIVVCPSNTEIDDDIKEHENITILQDELSWEDLTSSFQQRLLEKFQVGITAGVSIDLDEMPKSTYLICKWIKGSGMFLLAELLDAYITEMLDGATDIWNEFFLIVSNGFLTDFTGFISSRTVSLGTKETLLRLSRQKFLKKIISTGFQGVYSFQSRYVASFIGAKLIATVGKVFNLSATYLTMIKQEVKNHDLLDQMFDYFSMHIQTLQLPSELVIPPEVLVIALVKFDSDTAIKLLNDCKKSVKLRDIKICNEVHTYSILHFLVVQKKYGLLSLAQFILNEPNFKELLTDIHFRNIIDCCVEGTLKDPIVTVQDKKKLIECILKIHPSLVNAVVGGSQYPPANSPDIHIEIIKVLLENGAVVGEFNSILMLASLYLNTAHVDELIHYLGEKGHVNHLNCIEARKLQFSTTPLHSTIQYHEISESSLKVFLNAGVSVNTRGPVDMTVLQWAVVVGRSRDFLSLLVNLGAQCKGVTDQANQTILHHAAGWGNIDAIKYFAELGAHVNGKDDMLRTPLHVVFINPPKNVNETVKVLIDLGADIRAKNSHGSTPYQVALKGKVDDHTLELLNTGVASMTLK